MAAERRMSEREQRQVLEVIARDDEIPARERINAIRALMAMARQARGRRDDLARRRHEDLDRELSRMLAKK